mgnify:CR=1 FL=1
MATYDFRILLETVGGGKTSYYSSSFVDTSVDLVLSASQVFDRITGSLSCSYQNTLTFSQSTEPTTNDINTSFIFKDNNLLSASLTGSLDTGAVEFVSLNTEYDRLLRYKFFGEKVCSTLGLPENQWVYVDQFRLPTDDESNYFEGNVHAKSMYVSDNLTFSNQASINSDVPLQIDTGSDRHIKFIDNRAIPTPGLYMGYDKDNDVYEIGGDKGNFEIHSGSVVETTEIHKLSIISGSNTAGTINMRTAGIKIEAAASTEDPSIELLNPDQSKKFKFEIFGSSGTGRISMTGGTGDIEIRTQGFGDAIYIDNSEDSVGIGTDSPGATLHVAGNLTADSHITSSGNIIASSTDARIRVEATAGNHPGYEWLEAGTRKWLTFNDPANDHLTWKNASNTELMELDQDGHLYVNQKIIHLGDTDTFIDFTDDDINIQAGGVNFIDITQDSTNEITFNEAGAASSVDIDFRVEGTGDANLLFTDAGNDRVGIGIKTPTKKLQVEGDISGSGNVYATLPGYHTIGSNTGDGTAIFLAFGPIATTFGEDSSDANDQDNRIIAAFDGYVHSVILKPQLACGTSTLQLYKVTSGTVSDDVDGAAIVPNVSENMSSAAVPVRFNFGTSYSFVAGDTLAFKFDPTSAPSDLDGQVILMYHVTP